MNNMEKFSDYKKYFDIDFEKLTVEILNELENKQAMIDYNQKEQLQQGIDSLEQRIETIASQEQRSGYPYSINTVKIRGANGLQVQNVDLKDSGAFYKTFDVKVTNSETEIIANFDKGSESILDNFDKGYDFLGLTPNSLENFTWAFFYTSLEKKLKALFTK